MTLALPRIDTKPLAKTLLKTFGGLAGVFDALPKDLQAVKGVGPKVSSVLSVVKEVCTAYLKDHLMKSEVLNTPQAVVDYARMVLVGKRHEVVMVIFVDSRNHPIKIQPLFEGTVNESAVYPRRIVEEALSASAVGLILVHNHPSGGVSPSPQDMDLTKRVHEAAKTLEVKLLDHVIVGREGHFSFYEAGYLPREPRKNGSQRV